MKIIDPSVEIINEPDNMKRIELAGRVCYKSEERIALGTAEKFCDMLIRRNHTAMLEHSNIILMINTGKEDNYWVRLALLDAISDYRHKTMKPSMIREGLRLRTEYGLDYVYYFSGNVRAWREIIQFSDGDIGFPGNPLFKDLPNGSVDLTPFIVQEEDLDPEVRSRHGIISARFVCAEGVSLEMFRHRIAAATYQTIGSGEPIEVSEPPAVVVSPAQESTRYVDYNKKELEFIKPWWWDEGSHDERVRRKHLYEAMCWDAEDNYNLFRTELGMSPEAARAVLPKALKTEIIITQTPERWMDWLVLRGHKSAHPDMRLIAKLFKSELPLYSRAFPWKSPGKGE